MLEDECRQLDLKLISKDNYITSCQQLHKIQSSIEKLSEQVCYLNNAIITHVSHQPQNEELIKSLYQKRINELETSINEKVSLIISA